MPQFNTSVIPSVNTDVCSRYELITCVESVASRIIAARTLLGWTQEELAKRSGVSQGTIGNIESGTRQGRPSQALIAEALGVNARWLRDGSADPGGRFSVDPGSGLLTLQEAKNSTTNSARKAASGGNAENPPERGVQIGGHPRELGVLLPVLTLDSMKKMLLENNDPALRGVPTEKWDAPLNVRSKILEAPHDIPGSRVIKGDLIEMRPWDHSLEGEPREDRVCVVMSPSGRHFLQPFKSYEADKDGLKVVAVMLTFKGRDPDR